MITRQAETSPGCEADQLRGGGGEGCSAVSWEDQVQKNGCVQQLHQELTERWIPEASCSHPPPVPSSHLANGCNIQSLSKQLSFGLRVWGMLIFVGYYDFFFFPFNCIKPLKHGGKWVICMLLEFVQSPLQSMRCTVHNVNTFFKSTSFTSTTNLDFSFPFNAHVLWFLYLFL